MKTKLLKFSIDGLRIYKNGHFELNFLNEKRVLKDQIENHLVEKISNTVYKNNIVAIAGINASGKTTTLNLIKFILDSFIGGEGLNTNKSLIDVFQDQITIEVHILNENKVIKNVAQIRKSDILEFVEEESMIKAVHKSDKNVNFFDFTESTIKINATKRSTLGDTLNYLKIDDSFLPGILFGQKKPPMTYIDSMDSTDINLLNVFPEFEENLFQYLDPSIESLKLLTNLELKQRGGSNQIFFELKFYDHDPQVVSLFNLNNFLSSGTIRGLSIFNMIKIALVNGCYFLIDEIELHFNKAIVQNIIQIFQSEVNVNNATLIFSTHYSELLDGVERRDAIKVLQKVERKIKIASLSELAKPFNKDRTDIKNSDLILSGIFNTAPIYEKYWRVNRAYKKLAERHGDLNGKD